MPGSFYVRSSASARDEREKATSYIGRPLRPDNSAILSGVVKDDLVDMSAFENKSLCEAERLKDLYGSTLHAVRLAREDLSIALIDNFRLDLEFREPGREHHCQGKREKVSGVE